MRRLQVVLLVLALLSGGLAAGCGTVRKRALSVGVIDTSRIVSELPEYRDLNIDWLQERSDFFDQLPRDPRTLTPKQWEAIQKQAQERSARFDKLVRAFVEKAFDRISAATAEVAQAKDIDLVVINTPYYPSVRHYVGENLTTDILLKLRER